MRRTRALAALLVILLAACGAAPAANAPSPAPAATTPPATATPEPSPTSPPTPPATATPEPTTPPATATPEPTSPPATATPEAARYVFPLQPPEAGRYGVCHHDYPAADIITPAGTPFVAVTDGTVDFVSADDLWDPSNDDPAERGGLSVAIVGDDGVRYYGSHLATIAEGIAPGVRVAAGQLLGTTGDSGNAAGTDPHLHFGISHPTTADDWAVRRGEINPRPYLDAWRDSRDVTPNLEDPGGGVC